ncbi:avt3 [Symbiodinium sp. CCMP2592]|nr:avt3 [Symbiodinium sp. CCMP2592]
MSLVGALVKKFLALEKYFVKDKGIVTPHAGKRSLHVEQGVLNPELLAGLPLKLVDSCVNFDASVSFKEDQPNRVQSHDGISLVIEVLSSPYNEEGREEALLRLRRRKEEQVAARVAAEVAPASAPAWRRLGRAMRSKLVPEMQSRWEVDVKDVQLELRTDHTGHGISLRIAKLAVNRDRLGGSTEVNLEGITAELVSVTGGTWGFGAAPLLQHLGLSATLDSGAGREEAVREDHEDSARLNIVLSEASGVQPSLAASPGAVQVIKDLVDAYLQGAAAGTSALRASALERLPTVPRVTPEAYQELLKLERLPTREEQAQRHFIEAVASVAWLADCQVRAKALASSEEEVISLDAFLEEEPDDASKPQCFSLSLKVPSVAASCTSVKRPDQPGLSLILKGASLDLRGTLPATSVEADGLPQDIVVDAQLEHLALRVTTVHSAEDLVVLSGDVDRLLKSAATLVIVSGTLLSAVMAHSLSMSAHGHGPEHRVQQRSATPRGLFYSPAKMSELTKRGMTTAALTVSRIGSQTLAHFDQQPATAVQKPTGDMFRTKVMTYNILADELSSNLVPRTMEEMPSRTVERRNHALTIHQEPSAETLMQVFGEDTQSRALFSLAWHQLFEPGLPYTATSVEESFSCHSLAESSREDWKINAQSVVELWQALNDEYRKWHPMKTWIVDPEAVSDDSFSDASPAHRSASWQGLRINGPGKDEERPRLERFDGSQPSTYRRWRRKAELMLLALPNTCSKDRWGAKLLEYVAGEAEEVVEGLPLEKVINDGGHLLILEAPDARYKDLQKEALHNHLLEYFYGLQIKAGESYRNMIVRLETAYRRLQEHSVELPTEVRGWFMMRKLQLDTASEALLMTHTKGSLKYEDLVRAVQAIFPQGVAKNVNHKTKEVFEADSTSTELEDTEQLEEVFQAVADQVQASEEYDDEDALDVFETYKEVRKRVQQKRLGRGYKADAGNQWKLSGTVKGKIEMLKSRTKCHHCQERGHWKRECPRRGQTGNAVRQPRPGSSSDAMVADDLENGYKGIDEDHFLDVDELEKFEIFLAEKNGDVEVIVADRQEVYGDEGVIRGDFERSLSEFLSGSASNQDVHLSEAYMSECASLAEHGVPDTACRRTLVGERVVKRMSEALAKSGLRIRYVRERHDFRFGNAGTLSSSVSALIPVCLGGKRLAIRAAVLPGSGSDTPLLMSKELLRSLQVKLDMGSDILEIGKYGVKVKVRETERGHYALPLFHGLQKPTVKSNVQAQTHEVNAAEFSVLKEQARPEGKDLKPECHELHRRLDDGRAHGELHKDSPDRAATGEMSDISAKILDEAPDHSEDDCDAHVPGVEGNLGRMIFNIGKYQKNGQLMNFKTAYETDKRYVSWVRKFVKGRVGNSDKGSHPTMTQFRLYIALRDQRKSQRLQASQEPIPSAARSSMQAPAVMQSRPKAKSKAAAKPSVRPPRSSDTGATGASTINATEVEETVWENQWLVMQEEPEETATERRRRIIRQRIEELTFQLETLEDEAEL